MSDPRLARLTAQVAAHLEQIGYPAAPVVRRAARELLAGPERHPDGCQGCGERLVQSGRGRPRKWCSETCRRRHRP